MKEQTRKDIQQKLADFKQPAPEISWTELEKALATNRKVNAIPMWRKRLAAAAIILLISGLGWQLSKMDNPAEGKKQTAYSDTLTKSIEKEMAKPFEESIAKSIEESESVSPVKDVMKLMTKTESCHPEKRDETTEITPAVEAVEPSERTDQSDNPQPARQQVIYSSDIQQVSSKPSNRLTAKVYLSNPFTGSNSMNSITPRMYDATPLGYTENCIGNSNDNKSLYNQQPTVEEHADHHHPIRLGVSFRYQLDSRWSIETGLSYTYHSSDITRKMAGYTYKIKQKLSYIGIPVNANYQLWSDRHFSIYTSAGVMVEKMVRGRHYNEDHVYTEDVTIRPLQFSLNGGAGAEIKIDRTLRIYAEPALTYHIDNHNSVPTYYQDKPLSFNLNLGLRFNINNK